MSQDAIVVLKAGPQGDRALLREVQKSSTTPALKEKLLEQMIELLRVHTYIENEVMYPRVRDLLPDSRTTCSSPTRNTTSRGVCR